MPQELRNRYCSRNCWGTVAARLYTGAARPKARKVERPSYAQLKADLASLSCVAVGRKYSVSDNAVRKWLRSYERQTERDGSASGVEPEADRHAA